MLTFEYLASDTLYEENYITYYIDENDYETDYESYIVKGTESEELKAMVERLKADIDVDVRAGTFPGLYAHEIIIRGTFIQGKQIDVDEFTEDKLSIDSVNVYDELITNIKDLEYYSPDTNWNTPDTQEWIDACNRAHEADEQWKKDRWN